MVKKMLKVMMLILAVCMLPSCVKRTPCPKPLPLDIQQYSRSIDATLKHVIANYASEKDQVGDKVNYIYEDPKYYRDRVSYGTSFKKTWESLTFFSAKHSGVFNPSSNNDLMLEIEIKELHAPEVIDHILWIESVFDAKVTALYTLKNKSNGEVVLRKQYSAIGTCKEHGTSTIWECAANPNIQDALRRAIVKVNDQFIGDMLTIDMPETQQETQANNKTQFLAGTRIISAKYSKALAKAKYGVYTLSAFDPSIALSEFEKMFKLRVISSRLYSGKSDHEHKVYATIKKKWHKDGIIFIGTPHTEVTVEYKIVSTGGKQDGKILYRKDITKKIDKQIDGRGNYVPDILYCLGLTLDEFMKDMHELAKKNPEI